MTSFKMTKSMDVGKAQGSLASWARKLQGRPLIVTERGKPLVLVPVEEGTDVESLSLSMNPKFVGLIEKSRARHLRNGTNRDALREAYRRASKATRASLTHELRELDHLTGEGLPER